MDVEAVTELGAGEVLAAFGALRQTRDDAERDMLLLAASFADLHDTEARPVDPGPRLPGTEQPVALAGAGTPRVWEFAIAEVAVELHTSTFAARRLLGDALELRHRLPQLWAGVRAGRVLAWRARRVAAATRHLAPERAGFVDAQVVDAAADAISASRFELVIEAAVIAADPEAAAAREEAAARARFAKVGQSNQRGQRTLYVRTDAAQMTRIEASIAHLAHALRVLGDPGGEDDRRIRAVLILMNPLQALRLLQALHTHHTTSGAGADGAEEGDGDDPSRSTGDRSGGSGSGEKRKGGDRDGPGDGADVRGGPEPTPSPEPWPMPGGLGPAAGWFPWDETLPLPEDPPPDENDPPPPPGPTADPTADPGADPAVGGEPATGTAGDSPAGRGQGTGAPGPGSQSPGVGRDRSSTGAGGASGGDDDAPPGAVAGFLQPFHPAQVPPCGCRGGTWLPATRDLMPQVTLYLHGWIDPHATTPGFGHPVLRWEGEGPISPAYLTELLGPHCRFTVKGVIDPAGSAPVDGYEIPARHREALHLRTPADVFPYAVNLTRAKQVDHTRAYQHHKRPGGPDVTTGSAAQRDPEPGWMPGQTGLHNLGAMTTYHHRLKTHAPGWAVAQPFPGTYLWRAPHGSLFLVDHTGTTQLHGPRTNTGRTTAAGTDTTGSRVGADAEPRGTESPLEARFRSLIAA